MHNIKRRVISWLSVMLTIIFMVAPITVYAEKAFGSYDQIRVAAIIQGIIDWKKADTGAAKGSYLLNNIFLQQAGETAGDWFPIGLGRFGAADDYQAYLAVITDKIQKRYQTKNKLHAVKATEWHRISLAVLSMGGDPTAIGKDPEGKPIDLIADGTYNRGKTVSLGRQGINGWIWGLIALDSMRYPIPAGAYYSREDIIQEILRQQLADGGFALSGEVSDPDITAMAVQALSPYYNDGKPYTYQLKKSKETVTRTVRQVIDDCIRWLSAAQQPDGDYTSWGTQNLESTCQVTVALCCLGIDPETDVRFIKNGNSLLDGMMKYRMADGGFIHSFTYDPDNPTALPDKSNTMASEQALYTWVAVYRLRQAMRNLYDFRPEWSQEERSRIDALIKQINALPETPSKAQVEAAYHGYCAIPELDRCYVSNYWMLAEAMEEASVEAPPSQPDATNPPATDPIQNGGTPTQPSDQPTNGDSGNAAQPGDETGTDPDPDMEPLLYFSPSDRSAVDTLPEKLTTEYYVTVTKLLYRLENSEDFDQRDSYKDRLQRAKAQIESIQMEIDAINAEVLEKLYPFDSLSLSDKKTVDRIVARYNALSEYDRGKIDRWEDVVKTKTKIDNLLRGIIIAVVLIIVAGGVIVFVVLHIRRRRRSKRLPMEELAAQYADEDESAES